MSGKSRLTHCPKGIDPDGGSEHIRSGVIALIKPYVYHRTSMPAVAHIVRLEVARDACPEFLTRMGSEANGAASSERPARAVTGNDCASTFNWLVWRCQGRPGGPVLDASANGLGECLGAR
jgi:hypothetical protein